MTLARLIGIALYRRDLHEAARLIAMGDARGIPRRELLSVTYDPRVTA